MPPQLQLTPKHPAQNNQTTHFPVRTVAVPSWATRATLHSVFTGHGSDNNNCAEFCVTTHAITVNGIVHSETFDNAGTDEGCTYHTLSGALPNEHGTWLYGRDGWCDGSAVRPWARTLDKDPSNQPKRTLSLNPSRPAS